MRATRCALTGTSKLVRFSGATFAASACSTFGILFFREINTLAVCPQMPYRDPARPFVHAWYASAEGGAVDSWCPTLSEANQDRLVAEGGACIMYVHFAKGFVRDGKLHARFEELMRRLAGLGGWFVPVGTLLDFLAEKNGGVREITPAERAAIESRWLWTKLRHGSS